MNILKIIQSKISGFGFLDEKQFDITFNYINNLVNSNELLLFCLTKLSLIPMVDYFSPVSKDSSRKVYEEFGLNEEQANRVQSLNIDLLNIQKVVQLLCSQTFAKSSIVIKMFNMVTELINSENDEALVGEFMNTIEALKSSENQAGGGLNTNDPAFKNILKLLILFLLFIPSIQSSEQLTNNLELVIKKNDAYNPYNTIVISEKTEEEFLYQLTEREFKQKSIDLSRTVAVYDSSIKQSYDNFFGTVVNYLTQVDLSGKQTILNIVDEINTELRTFSVDVEKNCVQLMKNSYDKRIFATWDSLDNIETTKKKIEEAEKLVEKQNAQSFSKIGTSTVAAAVSATMGDGISAAVFLAEAGESLWELLSSTKKKQESIEMVTTELQPKDQLSVEAKREHENKLYTFSKFYCSLAYNLQLGFDEQTNTLNVFGDKIEYSWILNLITVLEENLKVQITTLSVDVQTDKSKLTELNILVSTLQRLDILKSITMKLSDIINFSFKSHIMKLQLQPSKNTINEVKVYFDDQMNELNLLLMKLNEIFPKQREKIQQEMEIVEADIELKTLEQNLLDIKSNADDIIRQRSAERYAVDMASSWMAIETYTKSWVTIGENLIKLTGESLGTTLGGLTREILNVASKVPKEMVSSGLSFLNNVLYQLISNPSGFLILSAPLFIGLLYLGQLLNFIKIFTWGGQKFMLIIWGGFVMTYKFVATPFGYMLELVKTCVITPNRANQGVQQQQQLPQIEQAEANQQEEEEDVARTLVSLGYEEPTEEEKDIARTLAGLEYVKQYGSSMNMDEKKSKYKHTKRDYNKFKKQTKRKNKKSKKHKTRNNAKKHKMTKRN